MDGLIQERINSIANALVLRQPCINQTIYTNGRVPPYHLGSTVWTKSTQK